MKTALIILLFITSTIAYWLGTTHFSLSPQSTNTITEGSGSQYFFPDLHSSPTPTISFTMKQQCSDDANEYINRENQNYNPAIKYELLGSTYSFSLNTCLASVNYYGQNIFVDEIVDTLANTTLAARDYNNSNGNFIPKKSSHVSAVDYVEFEDSVGL